MRRPVAVGLAVVALLFLAPPGAAKAVAPQPVVRSPVVIYAVPQDLTQIYATMQSPWHKEAIEAGCFAPVPDAWITPVSTGLMIDVPEGEKRLAPPGGWCDALPSWIAPFLESGVPFRVVVPEYWVQRTGWGFSMISPQETWTLIVPKEALWKVVTD